MDDLFNKVTAEQWDLVLEKFNHKLTATKQGMIHTLIKHLIKFYWIMKQKDTNTNWTAKKLRVREKFFFYSTKSIPWSSCQAFFPRHAPSSRSNDGTASLPLLQTQAKPNH